MLQRKLKALELYAFDMRAENRTLVQSRRWKTLLAHAARASASKRRRRSRCCE
jgi:hypothetical protein